MANYFTMSATEFDEVCNDCSSKGNKNCSRCYKRYQHNLFKSEEIAKRRAHMMMTAKITVINPATTEK